MPAHTKRSTIICDIKTQTFTTPVSVEDKAKYLKFTADGNKMLSDTIDLCAASVITLHVKYNSNVTVSILDKDATDHFNQNVVLATAAAGSFIEINKELIRKLSVNKAIIVIDDGSNPINTANLKVMLKVTYEYGGSTEV